MFNPLEHLDHLVYSNIDRLALHGYPAQDPVMFPGGFYVPAARHPEAITYWLQDGASYRQISDDQAFAQNLWLHFKFGASMVDAQAAQLAAAGLVDTDYRSITQDAMREAVMSLPHVLETITAGGYSEAEVWAYTQAEAGWAVQLTGVPGA